MQRMIHPKALTLFLSSLLLGCVVFWAQAQTRKATPTPTPEKKIKIEETILRREGKNKIILKPGFETVKQGDNSVTVRRRNANVKEGLGVEGKFRCDCTGGTGSGACSISSNGDIAVCNRTSGSCDCALTITIG